MKKLIPDLIGLFKKYKISEFHTSFHFDSCFIGVLLRRLEDPLYLKVTLKSYLTDAPARDLPDEHEFLPLFRENILKIVESQILLVGEIIQRSSENDESFESLISEQQLIMEEYKQRVPLTDEQASKLHMFFSPGRVVRGLTNEEVNICIYFYPQRMEQIKKYFTFPPMLHSSLMVDLEKNINRTDGLRNAIYEIASDLANRPKPTHFN